MIKRTQPALQTIQYTSRKHSKFLQHTRLNLYKSLVRTSLTFAAPLLLSISNTDAEKIEIQHRKAIKNCLNLPRSYPNQYLYQASRIPNLSNYIQEISKNYMSRAINKPQMSQILQNPPENTTASKLMNLI